MIRSRNCDQAEGNEFAQKIITLQIDVPASQAGIRFAGVRMPFAGTLVSAHVYAATLTDADDSVRIDLHKGAASVLPATVDPVAADTATSLAPNATTFDAGDVFKAVITTGAGDAIAGTITLVVRPDLGTEV
jgi:hypothetical protein